MLFVSVNPFSSTSNNGKTFASFFEGYPRESIAQLYFHRELPSGDVCTNYFRITDEDLFRDLIRPWRVTGEPVSAVSSLACPIPEKTHTALKRSPTARLLRQLMWTNVRLENPELLAWLDQYRPEVIFFCGGDAAALYSKVMSLSNLYGAHLVYYITDDYVLPVKSRNVATLISRAWTRRVFRRITSRAALVLTIGELMSRTYFDEFGFVSVPVMNMVDVPPKQPEIPASPRKPLTLLFAGSMHSNRWQVLSRIADSIARLATQGLTAKLVLYGPEPEAAAITAVNRPPFAEYRGLLSVEELGYAISEADVLVHVESEDPASMAATSLSVSTKIPEYLASGRAILAIGPLALASIDYLDRNGAALVLDPEDAGALDEALERLARQPQARMDLATRGFALAVLNHDGPRTRRSLWHRLEKLTL